ncbi:MAG: hypothetical protein ACKO29_01830, partial [Actinomycetota bacterium]
VADGPVLEIGTRDRSPPRAFAEVEFLEAPEVSSEVDGPATHLAAVEHGGLLCCPFGFRLAERVGLAFPVIEKLSLEHALDLVVALTSSGVVGNVLRASAPVVGATVIDR